MCAYMTCVCLLAELLLDIIARGMHIDAVGFRECVNQQVRLKLLDRDGH